MGLLVKTALADQIIDILRDRIVAGDIPADLPIRQDALAAELGVSKIPLREAFAKLEQDGLVVSQTNRGYFVSPLSTEEALDVFDLRLKIEPEAVGAAAARLLPDDITRARRALAELNEATVSASPKAGALNRAYHMALIRPCRRPVTILTIERIQVIAERYAVKHLEPKGRPARASAEHRALLEAWSAGDARRAAALSADHIAATLDDLGRELRMTR
ncbi:MAG TPA: GntR family transcriptional regulator [Lichenihabitans sp.]|nr:GntR family transcriptional regulator [Lichenihabitans sp.]